MNNVPNELMVAYEFVVRRHEQGELEDVAGLRIPHPGSLEAWFQKVLADTLYEKELLLNDDIVLLIAYIADLLASQRGMHFRSIDLHHTKALTFELKEFLEGEPIPTRMLILGERAFIQYCFMPETRVRGTLNLREYSKEFGIRAYQTYDEITDKRNMVGKRMGRAFVPLGDIVREKFTPPC